MKKIYIIVSFVSIILIGMFSIACSSKTSEIIWYISDPYNYDINKKDIEPWQPLESERFDLFNERLKELEIPAKVTFKYIPEYQVTDEDWKNGEVMKKDLQFAGKIVETILKNDFEADIVNFKPIEYQQFIPLDEYFENQKEVKKVIPDSIWKANLINGKIYQIPKGGVSISETVYCFYKPFLEQYQVELNEKVIKQMSPKEVIELLLPYFEKKRFLNGQYYLTSASDLGYMNYFKGTETPVIRGRSDSNIALMLNEEKIVNLLETDEMREVLEIKQWIYDQNIDAHENIGSESGVPVFYIDSIASRAELNSTKNNITDEWVKISLGNEHISASNGNGILKDSNEKELAVQVLAASMYDEKLSNIMIYGVPEKDYTLKNGQAIYTEGRRLSSMGAFSSIGNDLIAYPNEKQVLNKKEMAEKLLNQAEILPYNNFTPIWNEELWDKMVNIACIYYDIEGDIGNNEISDLNAYIEEKKAKLKETGVDEVVSELQKQVDSWEE